MFDSDDAGREAAHEAAQVLTPGKAKIATLPLKDAGEMLEAGRGAEIISAIWQASPYRPEGFTTFGALREEALKVYEVGLPWFLPKLTALTYWQALWRGLWVWRRHGSRQDRLVHPGD